jgi:hypothetical protein
MTRFGPAAAPLAVHLFAHPRDETPNIGTPAAGLAVAFVEGPLAHGR